MLFKYFNNVAICTLSDFYERDKTHFNSTQSLNV